MRFTYVCMYGCSTFLKHKNTNFLLQFYFTQWRWWLPAHIHSLYVEWSGIKNALVRCKQLVILCLLLSSCFCSVVFIKYRHNFIHDGNDVVFFLSFCSFSLSLSRTHSIYTNWVVVDIYKWVRGVWRSSSCYMCMHHNSRNNHHNNIVMKSCVYVCRYLWENFIYIFFLFHR